MTTLTIVDNKRQRRSLSILLGVFALLNASCYKAMGGGWIPTSSVYPTGGDRATFGFSAMCKTTTLPTGLPGAALYDGQLEWQDGSVQFHGNVEPFDFIVLEGRCQDVRSTLASRGGPLQFGGTYAPQNGGAAGFFVVTVIDCSAAMSTTCVDLTLNGDFIQIQLLDGEYAGYLNAGDLEGGNIQVF